MERAKGNPLYRHMTEDEKETASEVISYPERKGYYKSEIWHSLQWEQPTNDGGEDDFSTKSIYVQVEHPKDRTRCSWYSIPVEEKSAADNSLLSTILSPIEGLATCDLQTAVAFPPNGIIFLGGSFRQVLREQGQKPREMGTGVKYYDLADKRWDELADLWDARDFPSVLVADGGKMYVFGGERYACGDNFAEVYYPFTEPPEEVEEIGGWGKFANAEKYSRSPLYAPVPGGFFTGGDGEKYLLFHSHPTSRPQPTIFICNMSSGLIDYAETPFPSFYKGRGAVVDGILYVYVQHTGTGDIRAYDLATKKWISGPVSGICRFEKFRPLQFNFLLHIGGKRLCIIYVDHTIYEGQEEDKQYLSEDRWDLRLVVTVFEVEKKNGIDNVGGLEAKVFSSRFFIIPLGCIIHDAIIVKQEW